MCFDRATIISYCPPLPRCNATRYRFGCDFKKKIEISKNLLTANFLDIRFKRKLKPLRSYNRPWSEELTIPVECQVTYITMQCS